MATVAPVLTRHGHHTVEFFYETMTTTDSDGAPIPAAFMDYADRSVQIFGTPGVGGNLRVEGSNDGGTTWAALNDPQGNPLNIGSAKVEAITEVTLLTRPNVTAGDGNTDIDVVIVCRRARSGQEV